MNNIQKNEKGFSTVEIILVVVIIALIGVVGWTVYKNHHKTTNISTNNVSSTKPKSTTTSSTSAKPTTSTQTANPYTGWLTYTTKYEKMSFKYPSDWTVRDVSYTANGSNFDDVQVFPANQTWQQGVNVQFEELVNCTSSTCNNENTEDQLISTTPITFLGQSDYLHYYSAGANPYDSSQTALSENYISTSSTQDIFPRIPWDSNNAWQIILGISSNNSNDSPTNPDFATDILIVESASH